MSLSATLKGVSTKLLTKMGQSMTWKRVTPGSYNTSTGTTATGTTATLSFYGLLESQSVTHGWMFGEGIVRSGDEIVTASAGELTTEPRPGDFITVGGVDRTVIQVRATTMDVAVVYLLLVRR